MTNHDPDTDGGANDPSIPDDVEAAEAYLRESGEPYVRATVVRRETPISAAVGDKAIVTEAGIQAGWVGGVGCAETAVVSESRSVLATGEAALIGLAPDPESIDRPGIEAFPLTCESGGTIEVFLDPVGTAPRLLVVGGSAIADAVVRGAVDLGFHVTVVDPADGDHPDADAVFVSADYREVVDAVGGAGAVVVASVGELDARGVAAGIELDAGYVGLVASRRRAAEVIERAAALLGVDEDVVDDAVQSPAGIDIGAESPAEIAVSILAELVRTSEALGRGRPPASASASSDVHGSGSRTDHDAVVDPVCGMAVDPATAAATVDHGGETYRFCGQGCADAFAERPGDYLETA